MQELNWFTSAWRMAETVFPNNETSLLLGWRSFKSSQFLPKMGWRRNSKSHKYECFLLPTRIPHCPSSKSQSKTMYWSWFLSFYCKGHGWSWVKRYWRRTLEWSIYKGTLFRGNKMEFRTTWTRFSFVKTNLCSCANDSSFANWKIKYFNGKYLQLSSL